MTTYDELDLRGKTFAQVTAELNDLNANNVKEDIKTKFMIDENHVGLKAIEWLGVLDDKPVSLKSGSAFDLTSDLMIKKMMIANSERDMVIMQHIFNTTNADGKKETIVSRMLHFGDSNYSSIASTVSLPAAISVKMILDKKITDTGVLIPIKRSIYVPILEELKKLNIFMKETIEDHFVY